MSPKNALSGASLALLALLAAAPAARAGDKTVLRPMLDVEQGWDSNIYNDHSGEEGSFVTRITPSLWLENTGELGHARLGLSAIGRNVWRESDLTGIDGDARGDFERKLTPRLTLFGDGLLEHRSGYDAITDGPSDDPTSVVLEEQPSWNRDRVGLGARYMLSERMALRFSGSAGRLNYEKVDDTGPISLVSDEGYYRDRTDLGAKTALVYQLSPLDQLSAGVDFDDTGYQNLGAGSNDSSIWSGYVGWARDWTPVWTTSATIGVSALDSTQRGVPQSGVILDAFGNPIGFQPLPKGDFSSSGSGLIGSLSIERKFARSSLQLSYDRDTRSTGGSGRTNFDIDSFTLSLTHRLAERVKLSLAANYSRYDSATDDTPNYFPAVIRSNVSCPAGGDLKVVGIYPPVIPGGLPNFVVQCAGASSEEQRDYTTLSMRLEWQVRRTLSAYAVARWYTATTDKTLDTGREYTTEDLEKYWFGVGARYYWDLGL